MKKTFEVSLLFFIFTLGFSPKNFAELPGNIRTESGIDMVLIPGGWLTKDSPKGQVDAKSRKFWVDSFYMDKYPVTQQHFQMIIGMNPSRWQQDNNPVERVTWVGAVKYCNKLSAMEGLQPVYNEKTWEANFEATGYRLPTETEWEYAARGGKDTLCFFGNDLKKLRFFAWIKENS
ncbi:MAG: formylglycine-generating enzyme family protein, partial [Candidatus Contubernalis sp.]|nr:formylglycine-generating enzyme family protein [Candidatus Contubernalis sp.]